MSPGSGPAGNTITGMANRTLSESILIHSPPDEVYDMVADVTRMGEWSPVCKACWWDEGGSAQVGAWFTGRNETPERTWETRSQVVTADRGKEFTFVVGGTRTRWSYTFEPAEEGAKVTESWELLPDGVEFFESRFGDQAQAQIEERVRAAREGIPLTLARIKEAAEGR